GRLPPDSRIPRIVDGTLVAAAAVAFPAIPGLIRPHAANDAAPLEDWTDPKPPARAYVTLVPQVDADGNEIAGIRLPDIAVPRGTFTGWNLYRPPYPAGELADREGTFLPFATTEAERGDDPRASLAVRYPGTAYADALHTVIGKLLNDRFLLVEDAERYIA
ncbi:MAG TPA: alpha/beta hydrolase domain-containing protein, partial [Rhodopila sp.]|nr:alpha/beta hydrolase domain-containing protein [Rhodopila sp.]